MRVLFVLHQYQPRCPGGAELPARGLARCGQAAAHVFADSDPASSPAPRQLQSPQNFRAPTGACLLMRREVYDLAGLDGSYLPPGLRFPGCQLLNYLT